MEMKEIGYFKISNCEFGLELNASCNNVKNDSTW